MTERACRIFISHGAHRVEEPATQRFLDALVKRLAATPGLQALTDQKDLLAGDEWLQRLYGWMGVCDAAVILLSPRAVTRENSSWVPRETSLLLWRKALDPRFVVIPVLIGGLKADGLAANPFIGDLRLTDLQLAPGLSDKAKIGKIVAALQSRLASGIARNVFDPLRVNVEDSLQRYAPEASISAALARHFGDDPWQPYLAAHQNLSLKMVRLAVADVVDAVIGDVILGSQGQYQLGVLLFEALFPLRLPAEAACGLLALCRQQEGKGSVRVHAQDAWIVRMLLRAATGLPRDDWLRTWHVVELPDGWGDDDQNEVTAYLAAELAEKVLGTNGWDDLCQEPEPLLALAWHLAEARRDTGAPVIVCAGHSARWVELAAALTRRFPTTVFVFWSRDDAVADDARCMPLSPGWASGEDRRWRLAYQRKLKQFGGASA